MITIQPISRYFSIVIIKAVRGNGPLLIKTNSSLMLILLALPAQAEKIKTVGGYCKAGLFGDLPGEIIKGVQFRIKDTSAFYTDYMGVGKRPAAVIAVASVRKAQLKNLVYLL